MATAQLATGGLDWLPLGERIRSGASLYGTFLNMGSSVAAEIAGVAGFDWALVDLEHGSGAEAMIVDQLRALELRGVAPVVRVESNDRARIGHVVDRGAAGVMVPRVQDAHAAADAVRSTRYPPTGVRGVALLNRAARFGIDGDLIRDGLDERIAVVVQIESVSAVEQIEQIAGVDGVDGLFVGPTDLTHSMGIYGQTEHPDYESAIQAVANATKSSGKAAGVLVPDAASAKRYVKLGYNFVAVGADSGFLLDGMRRALHDLRLQ